jgi:WD40 repeat protein
MAAFHSRIIILTLLLLPAKFTAGAQPPQPQADGQKPKTDLYGDPLLPGAIARMGSMHFRHADISMGVGGTFSPDGKVIVSRDDRSVRLWDASTGKLIRRLESTLGRGLPAISGDGKLLAVQRGDSLELRDAASGKLLRTIQTMSNTLLGFSRDSKFLATSATGGTNLEVVLWNAATGEPSHRLKGHDRGVVDGAFSPDGKTLVTMCYGKRICRWDITTGELLHKVDLPISFRFRTQLSPDGRVVAVRPSNADPTNEYSVGSLWDAATGKEICQLKEGSLNWRLSQFAFTPDSLTLATYCSDPKLDEMVFSLIDTKNGELRKRFSVPGKHVQFVRFAPNNRTLLVAGGPVIHLWDTATGNLRLSHPEHEEVVWTLAFTKDSRTLFSGAWDGTIRAWEAATGKQERQLTGHRFGVLSLAISQDGESILSGGYDGIMRLQKTRTGKELRKFAIEPLPEDLTRFGAQVLQINAARDGRSAVTFGRSAKSYEPLFQVWDLTKDKPVSSRQQSDRAFDPVTFSPDGKWILGCRDNLTAPMKKDSKQSPAEDSSGKSTAEIHEALTGKVLLTLRIPDENGHYHEFSPNGQLVAMLTTKVPPTREAKLVECFIRLFEIASGKERLAIHLPRTGDGFHVHRLAFSPDGRTMVASRSDKVLQFWDVATGREMLKRTGYESTAYALAFAPDGKQLASGHPSGEILNWRLTPEIDRRPNPPKADAKQVEQWWTALAGDDAKKAHAAIWGLVASPDLTLPFFRDRLRPAEAPPAEKLKQLIGDLDNEEFAKRNAANKELADFEELAEPAMREALKEEISAEKRKRLEKLVDITLIVRTPEKLRQLRALEVLEQIGTPDARQILAKLAQGVPEARLTREAKAALQRLERR